MPLTEGSSPRRTCLGTPCIIWERALRRYCLRAEGGWRRGYKLSQAEQSRGGSTLGRTCRAMMADLGLPDGTASLSLGPPPQRTAVCTSTGEREKERGSQREREGQRAKGGEERSDIWCRVSLPREPTASDESCSITGSP